PQRGDNNLTHPIWLGQKYWTGGGARLASDRTQECAALHALLLAGGEISQDCLTATHFVRAQDHRQRDALATRVPQLIPELVRSEVHLGVHSGRAQAVGRGNRSGEVLGVEDA